MKKVLMMVLVFGWMMVMPLSAQTEDATETPDEYTQTYIDGNILIYYPPDMTASTEADGIYLDFGLGSFINILTLSDFGQAQAGDLYDEAKELYDQLPDAPPIEVGLESRTLGEYPAYYFTYEMPSVAFYAYIFEINQTVLATIFVTMKSDPQIEARIAIMEGIIERMVVGEAVAEMTPEPREMLSRVVPLDEIAEIELVIPFISQDETIMASLPADWLINVPSNLIASNQTMLDSFADITQVAGDEDIAIQMITPSDVLNMPLVDTTPLAVIDNLQAFFETDEPISRYDDWDKEAYYVPLESRMTPPNAFLIVVELDEGVMVALLGITGDFDANEAVILAIVNSLEYTFNTP
ncbi:MAG: hypothetical protein MUE54_09765 [Anaerolineae bacterium]|nr:hypothetical protein [Anaerolineae bacterium]